MSNHSLFTQTNNVGCDISMSVPTRSTKKLNDIFDRNIKKSVRFSFLKQRQIKDILTIFILSALVTVSYGQDPIFENGIFDINSTVTTTSRTALVEADGFGTSTYQTEKLPNGNLTVRYTYDKPSVPNPLFITYAYMIEKLPSGDFAMDMQAAMSPLSLYIDTNAIQLSYTGDKIIIPNQFANNHEFPALSGFFTLKAIAKNDTLLTYHVSITNRKFTKKENIILNGKTYEAYTHTYNFVQKTFLDGNRPLSETAETVEETYLVGYGIVCQERQGTMIPINVQDGQGMEQKLISELLNIQ